MFWSTAVGTRYGNSFFTEITVLATYFHDNEDSSVRLKK